MKTAVYCSASNRLDEEYLLLGDEVGGWLARNGDSLVFGGATGLNVISRQILPMISF